MMLPFEPEDLDRMRARIDAALVETFEVWSPTCTTGAGEVRRCVFDWPDGMRMIISFDRLARGEAPVLHISASIAPDTPLSKGAAAAAAVLGPTAAAFWGDFFLAIKRRAWRLVGETVPLTMATATMKAVHLAGPTRAQFEALRNRAPGVLPEAPLAGARG